MSSYLVPGAARLLSDAEYATWLVMGVPPSDRALAGWDPYGKAARYQLGADAAWQERRDAARARMKITPRRSTA